MTWQPSIRTSGVWTRASLLAYVILLLWEGLAAGSTPGPPVPRLCMHDIAFHKLSRALGSGLAKINASDRYIH